MLFDRKVTEDDWSCGKGYKHYSMGNLLNKNVTSEKNDLFPRKKKNLIYCDGIQFFKEKRKTQFLHKNLLIYHGLQDLIPVLCVTDTSTCSIILFEHVNC